MLFSAIATAMEPEDNVKDGYFIPTNIEFSPTAARFVAPFKDKLTIYDTATGNPIADLENSESAQSPEWTPLGSYITHREDHIHFKGELLRVWDAQTCILIYALFNLCDNHAFSPDESALATFGYNRTKKIYELTIRDGHSGNTQATVPIDNDYFIGNKLQFTHDNKALIYNILSRDRYDKNGYIQKIVAVPSGAPLDQLPIHALCRALFTCDGSLIRSIFDLNKYNHVLSPREKYALIFTNNLGKKKLSLMHLNENAKPKIKDVTPPEKIWSPRKQNSHLARFSSDDAYLAIPKGRKIYLMDTNTGTLITTLGSFFGYPEHIKFSPDNQFLMGYYDNTKKVGDWPFQPDLNYKRPTAFPNGPVSKIWNLAKIVSAIASEKK